MSILYVNELSPVSSNNWNIIAFDWCTIFTQKRAKEKESERDLFDERRS